MVNIDFYVKSMESFKCYVIWEAYEMLPIAHWLVRVQGIREDMPSNMLSFINFEPLDFIEHTSWPAKPRLTKFPQWDSWAWIMSKKWDDVLWAWTMGFDAFFLYVNMSYFGL